MFASFRRIGLAILLSVTLTNLCAAQQRVTAPVATEMIAMRDGVKLATDVYVPGDGKEKYPVIVARTPYNKINGGGAWRQRPRGYAVVVQDLRGFKSQGIPAIIFGNDGLGEHQDGCDTLEWIEAAGAAARSAVGWLRWGSTQTGGPG